MIRALWYFIKLLVLVGAVIYLMSQSGQIVATWQDYKITVQTGFTVAVLFVLVISLMFLAGLMTRLRLWPREFLRARREQKRIKGYKALLQSMTSAAIGDYKTAYYMAHRAQKLLPPEESGLPLLLQAQSQPSSNSDHQDVYSKLLQNADTALLGMQGLTQKAILAGDFEKALLLTREAIAKYPKSISLLKVLYDLEVKNYLWSDALITLGKAQQSKIVPKDEARHERTALYTVLGDMALTAGRRDEAKQFFKMAAKESKGRFVPSQLRLAAMYHEIKPQKAAGLLKDAWKISPSLSIAKAWDTLWPEMGAPKKMGHLVWGQLLVGKSPSTLTEYLYLAECAIADGLWGEAKSSLMQAEKIVPCAEVYEMWIALEEKSGARPEVIRQWMDRARQSQSLSNGAGAWVCSKTGRHYAEWVAVVEPERQFNTLQWVTDASQHGVTPAFTLTSSATA